eukprot:Gb_07937 [translate_table: standard]
MDLKKVFDQTVRDLKREVNKKVLKVPGIEQKVLDVTSNEPWGPHGSVMADIAQATRNYNEYQLIMAVLWKRVNDTGKNWRHVYKALTVLEYLVAHGSERVIDELREHAYQISTLSDFQYVDSSGKDQGLNVRKKAQNIVALINDKERIREVRQKAVANRDKYRGVSSTGGIYKPSSYSSTGGGYSGDQFDEDRSGSRYGGREDGYGRDREWDRYRDEERYGRNGDSFNRDGDRYGRDGGERYSRDGDRYRDDDYGGGQDHEDDRHSSRRGDRSHDKEKDHAYEDDDRYSSRNGGGRVDEYVSDERYERKQSGGKMGAPPSYEESTNDSIHRYSDERDGGTLAATVAKASTRLANKSQSQDAPTSVENVANSASRPADVFDDFDPRGASTTVAAPVAAHADVDFFGPPSESVPPLPTATAIVPLSAPSSNPRSGADLFADASFSSTFTVPAPTSGSDNQPSEDLFGDSPFKALSSSSQDLFSAPTQSITSSMPNLNSGNSEGSGAFTAAAPKVDTIGSFGFVDPFQGAPSSGFGTTPQPMQALEPSNLFQAQTQTLALEFPQSQANNRADPEKIQQQTMRHVTQAQNPQSTAQGKFQQQKDKFEPKSTIWADTLSRGLIDLNISGPKINPLADIGIDLDSITRLEKRREEKERTSTASMASTVSMGKAMGAGSGLGRSGASTLPTPASPMIGSMGMGMGMGGYGMGMSAGAGMGGISGMGMGSGGTMGMGIGSGAGMGMGMGMGMPMGPGMGMNPGMGMPGVGMRPPMGMPPASGMGIGMNPTMGIGMNPMMGMGGYGTQQQQFGGYR